MTHHSYSNHQNINVQWIETELHWKSFTAKTTNNIFDETEETINIK